MDGSRISVRYARALFDAAMEKGQLEQTTNDMTLLHEVCRLPDFRAFVGNPTISPSRKMHVFTAAFTGIFSPLSMSLAKLVIKNGRERFFDGIARNYLSLSRKHAGITRVILTTAISPGSETLEKVKIMVSELLNTRVEMNELTNPALIGGFVIQIEDKLIDASVKTKLKKIQEGLIRPFAGR